uniref:Integrase catalytic domain-containing protein n=1 Tax=Strongyloides papillosus TaxID=174720 RepID=A0A0N5BE84_STREA
MAEQIAVEKEKVKETFALQKKKDFKHEITCNKCSGIGHYASVCPSKYLHEKSKRQTNAIVTKDSDSEEESECEISFLHSYTPSINQIIIDSGSSIHITNKKALLTDLRSVKPISVKCANSTSFKSSFMGTLCLDGKITLQEVYCHESAPCTLLSLSKLKKIAKMKIIDNNISFQIDNFIVHTIEKDDVIIVKCIDPTPEFVKHEANAHRKDINNKVDCTSCDISKMKRKLHNKENSYHKYKPLELVAADIKGPFKTVGYNKEKYWFILSDKCSGLVVVSPIRSRAEVPKVIKKSILSLNQLDNNFMVQRFRSDNAKEFISSETKQILESLNVIQETSTEYNPQENFVERSNQTIMNAVKTILHQRQVPDFLWSEIAKSVAIVLNNHPCGKRTISANHVFNRQIVEEKFKPIGCMVIFKYNNDNIIGINLGYNYGDTYSVYDVEKKKIFLSHDVKFHIDKNITHAKSLISSGTIPTIPIMNLLFEEDALPSNPINISDESIMNMSLDTIPSVNDALQSEEWLTAMNEELLRIELNDTWKIVDRENVDDNI